MQQKITPLIIAIIAVLLVIGGGTYWYFQSQPVEQPILNTSDRTAAEDKPLAATLAYQQGLVQVKVGNDEWQTVETDTVLHEGDSVKTDKDSKAIVELENGDVVRLGFTSEVFFTSLKQGTVTITQKAGASYNRVAKNQDRVYELATEVANIQALGTAFDVVITDQDVDVNVVESNVKVVTETKQEEVGQGDSATIDKAKKEVSVTEISKENLNNDWYKWNKEEDSKTTDKLGVLEEFAGPTLAISSPQTGAVMTDPTVTVTGTVNDPEAKLTINDKSVVNQAGQFSQELSLKAGKNVITVVAEDAKGNKTVKEVKVIYQTPASATPLKLEAETENVGVHLSWNESTNATFQFYKLVRSETNADLKYPEDGYLAKLDKGTEEYTDTSAVIDKVYYYRVCEVLTGEKVFCSNVVHMKGKTEERENKNANTNADTSDEETNSIKLSGEAKNDGIHLTWEVKNLTIEHGFKVVKGATANPKYPGNDFQYLTDSTVKSYIWALTDGQKYHFRVCQYDGNGTCLVYSNDVTVTANNVVSEEKVSSLSVKAEESGVGLWWTDTSNIAGFKYYKVVRSETNANLKYPDDGYIAVKSKGEESHRDYSAVKGKSYYYRICAVGDSITCSNMEQTTAINENAAPVAVSLSGTYTEGKTSLTWSASDENDFKYYKVVWSATKSSPVYPADGYLTPISEKSTVTYTDTGAKTGTREAVVDLATGTHYYSVCVVDQADQVTCSNTVSLASGVIR